MRYTLLGFILLLATKLAPAGMLPNISGYAVENVAEYNIYSVYNGDKIGDDCQVIDFISLCDDYGYSPNHLSRVIEHESNYRTTAVNRKSGASGLIQFMPATARSLGTSVHRIRNMSFSEQLVLTMEYLRNVEEMTSIRLEHNGLPSNYQISDSIDMYLAVFYPLMLAKRQQGSTVISTRGRQVYNLNRVNDQDHDGDIDLRDIGRLMRYDVNEVDTVKVFNQYRVIKPIQYREYGISVRL